MKMEEEEWMERCVCNCGGVLGWCSLDYIVGNGSGGEDDGGCTDMANFG